MKTEHLSKLEVALKEMEDRTEEIREAFASEKMRERYMRDLTEATCSRVLCVAQP
jgi:CHASE3 domain sensor protein